MAENSKRIIEVEKEMLKKDIQEFHKELMKLQEVHKMGVEATLAITPGGIVPQIQIRKLSEGEIEEIQKIMAQE